MDPINTTPVQAPAPQPVAQLATFVQTPLAPLPLRVFTLLGIIGSILTIIFGFIFIGLEFEVIAYAAVSPSSWLIWLTALWPLAIGTASLVMYLGLRHMKRWALLMFTILTGVQVVVYLFNGHRISDLGFVLFNAVVLVYSWTLSKRMS